MLHSLEKVCLEGSSIYPARVTKLRPGAGQTDERDVSNSEDIANSSRPQLS